jgi:tRNA pseudouridine38-40 synthase
MEVIQDLRIKMCVQYDGTQYAGFQRQKNHRTVQGVLEDGLENLLRHPVTVRAAGRTDAGVHARGQVIAFNTAASIPPERIPMALRTFLPEDVIVDSARAVAPEFDPLRDAVSKTYCYRIWKSKRPSVLAYRYVLWYPGNLDFESMLQETVEFEGIKDFANFRAQGSSARTTVRHVFEARWVRKDVEGSKDALWEFWVTADGFLYKMLRLMAGTLIDIGRGHLPQGTVRRALEAAEGKKKFRIGKCAPGKGLCLEKVRFS